MTTRSVKLIAVFAAAVIIGSVYVYWAWTRPLTPGAETYLVKPGMTLRGLAHELSQRGVISESYSLVWLARITGRERSLKAGEYRFRDGITVLELLEQVNAGRVVEYPVVLVEGWNFSQFLQALAATPKLTQTVTGLSPRTIMERLGHAGQHPEGMFYPDTYFFSTGHTDLMILTRAYEKMQTLLQREWESREANLPLRNAYDALILASIVEKETGNAEERRSIAGVFINRLRRGMRLQTDPTVIYGMGAAYNGNIRLSDLRRDTPYNTYTRAGLPPTPIAMPGREAIAAAVHPADTRALYFVARGDGSHIFSENLQEHNNAVIQFQVKSRPKNSKSYRSAPEPRERLNTMDQTP